MIIRNGYKMFLCSREAEERIEPEKKEPMFNTLPNALTKPCVVRSRVIDGLRSLVGRMA